MNRTSHIAILITWCLFWPFSAGCGNSVELGQVAGTITLDGQPLAKAKIEFQPQEIGSPSYGRTDENGHYELMFAVDTPGAMLGKHVVRISTFRQEPGSGGPPVTIPERVPPKYNEKSELIREVKPGRNTFDFRLEGALSGPDG